MNTIVDGVMLLDAGRRHGIGHHLDLSNVSSPADNDPMSILVTRIGVPG